MQCCGLRVHGRSGRGWQDGRLTGACQSSCTVVVELNGADEWPTTVATRDISLSGLKEFVYKSDGERSIATLKQEVARRRRRGCRSDRSAVRGESGQRERGQRGGPAVTRTHVHTAQEFHDVKLEPAHLVRIFAVEYSAQPVNRAQQAVKDYSKAFGLRKGRPHMRKLQPFAEAVMYLRVVEMRARQNFEDRWNTGIYLGLVDRSNMVLVGTTNGVVKVNCIKRLPMNEADPKLFMSIPGYPWRFSQARCPPWSPVTRSCPRMSVRRRLPTEREEEAVPRRVQSSRNVELPMYGFTHGCRNRSRARETPRGVQVADPIRPGS